MLPSILRNFNLFVDGQGYAGKVDELTLPKLTLKTEEHRAGGMDAPIELDMGMEKLECEFTLSEYAPQVLKLFGLVEGGVVPLTLRGAEETGDGTIRPIVVNLQGLFRELDSGNWKAGDKAQLKCQIACRYYKLTSDSNELIEIDVENMVRKINGVDQLQAMREAIGI